MKIRAFRMLGSLFFAVAALGNVRTGDPIGFAGCVLLAAAVWPGRTASQEKPE